MIECSRHFGADPFLLRWPAADCASFLIGSREDVVQIAAGIFVFIVVGLATSFLVDSREHISFAAGIGNALIAMVALMAGLWLFLWLIGAVGTMQTRLRAAPSPPPASPHPPPLQRLPPAPPVDVEGEALRLVEEMGPQAAAHARQCASVYSVLGNESHSAGWRAVALLCDELLRPSVRSSDR